MNSRVSGVCWANTPPGIGPTYRGNCVRLETFVDRDRFRGTCYRAANWIRVGQTQGRTRNGAREGRLCLPFEQELP